MASGRNYQRRKAGLLGLSGVLATVLLHGLIFSALLWGDGAHLPRKPDLSGAGANAPDTGSEAVSVLFFIDEPTAPRPPDEEAPPVSSRSAAVKLSLVKIAAPDPISPSPLRVSDDGDRTEITAESDAEAASRALLFGRYEGQIKARIERAWQRPRSEIGDQIFLCHVKVLQNQVGKVLEVDLVQCNGTPRWQLSLATAIQSASPLPAPPDPSVYSEALALTFTAAAFAIGADAQEYEPIASAAVAGMPVSASSSLAGQSSQASLSPAAYERDVATGVVQLRITGSPRTEGRISDSAREVPNPDSP